METIYHKLDYLCAIVTIKNLTAQYLTILSYQSNISPK